LNIGHDVTNSDFDVNFHAMKLGVWNISGLSSKLTGRNDICDSTDFVDYIKSFSIIGFCRTLG
jgi:hypothetical protein